MALDSRLSATVGERVLFTFQVRNAGLEPLELTFRSGKTADLTVHDRETGEVVWEWGAEKMFTQALRQRELAPDEALEWEYEWPDPREGEFDVIATLRADQAVEARLSLSV